MHARKTRQRKKEAMHTLQQSLDELKEEQIRLRQVINEKNTANILVGLFWSNGRNGVTEDPGIETLLRRPPEEIPDASKLPELPALILPGQHHSKKQNNSNININSTSQAPPADGIDYQLLGKDRSKCTPAELDQIRRERNRMHAKRTRDRKRLLMDEMEKIIKKLEDENALLQDHLEALGCDSPSLPPLVSPNLTSAVPPQINLPTATSLDDSVEPPEPEAQPLHETPQDRVELVSQLKSLLMAAWSFERSEGEEGITAQSSPATAISVSGNSSCSEEAMPDPKRRKLNQVPSIPETISI